MNSHIVILAAAFILPAVTRISYSDQRSPPALQRTSISEMQYLRIYTTGRVYKDDI